MEKENLYLFHLKSWKNSRDNEREESKRGISDDFFLSFFFFFQSMRERRREVKEGRRD